MNFFQKTYSKFPKISIKTDSSKEGTTSIRNKREANVSNENSSKHKHEGFDSIAHTWQDGVYLFMLNTEPIDDKEYSLTMTVSFKYKNGYLSANDWPFLPVIKTF